MAEGQEEEKKKIIVGAGGDEEKIIVGAGGDAEEMQIVLVGAGQDEEKQVVLAGAGNEQAIRNDGQFSPPPGFRFKPRHDELVMYYLLPKLQGKEHVPNKNIIEANVYQCHPDKLIDKYRDRGDESWYFLSPRARKYKNGNRPSRSTEDKCGRWKASTGKKKVDDEEDGGKTTTKSAPATVVKVAGDGKTVYTRSTLTYHVGPIKGEKKSKWLMKELTVPEYENKRNKNGGGGNSKTLDQYVMCRIYETTRKKGDDDEAGPSGTKAEPADTGQGTTAGPAKLSEKQAGKRPPAEQEQPASKRARHPNPDRLNLGPPAPPLHGNGAVQAPFRPPGYYDGGPGRPMGYCARAPMPRPPFMYHNVQLPPVAFNDQRQVPRQPMAHNGQGTVPRQPVACSGQVPPVPRQQCNGQGQVPRQPMACNGQGPPVPRQQMPYNVQVPVQRQQVPHNSQVMRAPMPLSPPYRPAGTPNSYAQNQKQTVMTRPPCPAGQAVNPQSSVVPRPAQTQKQPETEQMRASRVIEQLLAEFYRTQQISTRPPASAAHAAQQQRPTAFTHHHHHQQQQQRTTAFTQQQPTAFTHQQQQPPMAFTHHQQRPMMAFTQQQQPRPYLGTNAYHHHHAGAMVPRFSLDNFNASEAAQHYHHSQMILPAASGSAGGSAGNSVRSAVSGAGGAVSGANQDCNNDENMEFVESATGNPRLTDGNLTEGCYGRACPPMISSQPPDFH